MRNTIDPEHFLDERGFPRRRNLLVATLVEGDVLINGETINHVADGEISIFADGTIDESKGELAEIDSDGLAAAMGGGVTIFNMSDVK
jgi:hypothetical protein